MDTENRMLALLERLFPICRSITGNGVRETLKILQKEIPLQIREVPSGTKVFDWTVPKEWNIRDAYIKDPSGKKIVDFKKLNIHVLNYSAPVKGRFTLTELKEHLHSLPEQPDLIPYRTSYYKENWGFCLPHSQLSSLQDGSYEVLIDSTLSRGSLTYGELYVPGKTTDEILISCYVCHPSLANDNLSGVVLSTFLAKAVSAEKNLRYSYRFLFIPETIGAITWLSKNRSRVSRIKHGLVATCVGDSGPFTYKRSRAGNAPIDAAAELVLKQSQRPHSVIDFFPSGSDERQFSSPGFNLPVGSLMRTMYGTFPQYHTSADNLDFIDAKHIDETLQLYKDILFALEHDDTFKNMSPYGEPQLGKRGLYSLLGGQKNPLMTDESMLWILNFSDGKHSLLDIAKRSGISMHVLSASAQALFDNKLLKHVKPQEKR